MFHSERLSRFGWILICSDILRGSKPPLKAYSMLVGALEQQAPQLSPVFLCHSRGRHQPEVCPHRRV
jgi:hypothetical protein